MGPFHEFKVSLVPAPLQMFFAEAGVVAYWRLSHCWPPQGLSHAQLPEEHTPFSEQSVLVVQVAQVLLSFVTQTHMQPQPPQLATQQ